MKLTGPRGFFQIRLSVGLERAFLRGRFGIEPKEREVCAELASSANLPFELLKDGEHVHVTNLDP